MTSWQEWCGFRSFFVNAARSGPVACCLGDRAYSHYKATLPSPLVLPSSCSFRKQFVSAAAIYYPPMAGTSESTVKDKAAMPAQGLPPGPSLTGPVDHTHPQRQLHGKPPPSWKPAFLQGFLSASEYGKRDEDHLGDGCIVM